jgi:hypothetical protein
VHIMLMELTPGGLNVSEEKCRLLNYEQITLPLHLTGKNRVDSF